MWNFWRSFAQDQHLMKHIDNSYGKHALPGAEWYNVLIRAPVTSIRHFEQIPILLKDFFRGLNPIEDELIIYNFLTEVNKDKVNK